MNMKPIITKITTAQRVRAEEKSWELFEWMTRVLAAVCHPDAASAATADPDIFDDGIALQSYIANGTKI